MSLNSVRNYLKKNKTQNLSFSIITFFHVLSYVIMHALKYLLSRILKKF